MCVKTNHLESFKLKGSEKRINSLIQAANEATVMGKLIHPFIVRYH